MLRTTTLNATLPALVITIGPAAQCPILTPCSGISAPRAGHRRTDNRTHGPRDGRGANPRRGRQRRRAGGATDGASRGSAGGGAGLPRVSPASLGEGPRAVLLLRNVC